MRACRSMSLVAVVSLPLLAAPLLAGCGSNAQNYGAGGAAIGAVACGVIGNALFRTAGGTLGSAAACGAAGYFIGSAIGRRLDERDRTVAQAATQRALAAPIRYRPNQTDVVRPAVSRSWASDHGTGVRGSASVIEATRQPNGGECRTVREIAYIKGQEEAQQTKYCKGGDGSWVAT